MRKYILIACVVVLSCFLLAGCDGSVRTKRLIIQNDSPNTIDTVRIRQYAMDADARIAIPNALGEKTIAAGACMPFFLAPYGASNYVRIDDTGDCSKTTYFTYTYLVDGKNEDILLTYSIVDGYGSVTLEGSNATKEDIT
ncbi:MAG: hypothetical protein AB9828_11400 [Sphaerochaetaceae bacterium]